jgi:surface protein
MFLGCESILSLPDLSKWDINNTINISWIFSGCSSLTYLPNISKWNNYKANKTESLFFL